MFQLVTKDISQKISKAQNFVKNAISDFVKLVIVLTVLIVKLSLMITWQEARKTLCPL